MALSVTYVTETAHEHRARLVLPPIFKSGVTDSMFNLREVVWALRTAPQTKHNLYMVGNLCVRFICVGDKVDVVCLRQYSSYRYIITYILWTVCMYSRSLETWTSLAQLEVITLRRLCRRERVVGGRQDLSSGIWRASQEASRADQHGLSVEEVWSMRACGQNEGETGGRARRRTWFLLN